MHAIVTMTDRKGREHNFGVGNRTLLTDIAEIDQLMMTGFTLGEVRLNTYPLVSLVDESTADALRLLAGKRKR